MNRILLYLVFVCVSLTSMQAQNSVAHEWIEANLESVRRDFAKPVVHARNLFHTSVAMYDAWAVYDETADTYFLGKSLGDYECPFDGMPPAADSLAAQEEAMSYAAYRMLVHRYQDAPQNALVFFQLDTMMTHYGYDKNFTSVDYANDGPAALGNYIAARLIQAAMLDGANESDNYDNEYYQPANVDLVIDEAHFMGNPDIDSLNRWQPIGLTLFCDQSGNSFVLTPEFLGAEWGNVIPFSLESDDMVTKSRDGHDWNIFHDPGHPPYIDTLGGLQTEQYRWGMDLVAKWSSFLDPSDPTMIDISPNNIGNIPLESLPTDFADFPSFYDRDTGGDISLGYTENPATGAAYPTQMVRRGDYARILAEFWADGPDSETPPGHWFAIYNEVSQHPDFTWQWNGQGEALTQLEYDIKTYFTLGGAMHDAAIAAWSVKGYYDYIRPVSAIRAMAELGQSSDPLGANYHPAGLELEPGFIELIQAGDTIYESDGFIIADDDDVNLLKMRTWLGPLTEDTCIVGFQPEYQTEVAGVGWKFALDWWPYQRPTFVTPPFAGYVSGHSTFSRAAAEIMTLTTGDNYFPGGVGEFHCPQDQYLVFEDGPSTDITLQWATYQDASDQCSLSRIYGGIHPPADDIPGRLIGYEVGHEAFALAETYFLGGKPRVEDIMVSDNIISDADAGGSITVTVTYDKAMNPAFTPQLTANAGEATFTPMPGSWISERQYSFPLLISDANEFAPVVNLSVTGGKSTNGVDADQGLLEEALVIDMLNPSATLSIDMSFPGQVLMNIEFSENMEFFANPQITFPVEDGSTVVSFSDGIWLEDNLYGAAYNILNGVQLSNIDVQIANATDNYGNLMVSLIEADQFSIDTRAPIQEALVSSAPIVADAQVGMGGLDIAVSYDEAMDITVAPSIAFTADDPLASSLVPNTMMSGWTDDQHYSFVYDVMDAGETLNDIQFTITGATDTVGLTEEGTAYTAQFTIDTENPIASTSALSETLITDNTEGPWTYFFAFSEEMDQSMSPSISFPDEDPASTLTFDNITWAPDGLGASAAYTITDAGQNLADIDLAMADASDLAGNAIEPFTAVDMFSVEMDNPSVLSLEADQFFLNDASAGSTLSFDLVYDEAMDTEALPTLGFDGLDLSGTLTDPSGTWISDTEYQVTYTVADANVDVDELNVTVGTGSDLVGNAAQPFIENAVMSIDMENPQATAAMPTPTLIDNDDVGLGTFSIDLDFSEAMNSDLYPTLSFPTEDASSSLNLNGGLWTSPTQFQFIYDVNEGFTALADIDILVTGATDLAGNAIDELIIPDVFDIDIASSIAEFGPHVVSIYPNPIARGQALNLRFTDDIVAQHIRIIDLLGSEVALIASPNTENGIYSIDTSELNAGIYLLEVEVNGQVSVHRFTVSNSLGR